MKWTTLLPCVAGALFNLSCTLQTHAVSENQNFIPCPDKRPEVCTMQYDPVCATLTDKMQKTFSNACTACAEEQVTGYIKGSCQ